MLRVKYSEEWQRQREQLHSTIKEYVRPFDWSYTTSYKGTVLPKSAIPPTPPPPPGSTPPPPEPPIADSRATAAPAFTSTTNPLPIPLLTLPDPILLFDNVVLYEDELADNGISLLSVKIRVMPHRLLILSRFFLRLDGVLCRIRDVRIYIDFGVPRAPGVGSIQGGGEWGTAGPGRPLVMREYTEKEGTWDEVLAGLRGVRRSEIPSVLRDAGRVVEVLGEVKRCEREMVVLG
ncbi:TIP41-like protein [Kalaharituber pfeilii]|nr:TIP41-like protein [Kalaharituber pfeilii]